MIEEGAKNGQSMKIQVFHHISNKTNCQKNRRCIRKRSHMTSCVFVILLSKYIWKFPFTVTQISQNPPKTYRTDRKSSHKISLPRLHTFTFPYEKLKNNINNRTSSESSKAKLRHSNFKFKETRQQQIEFFVNKIPACLIESSPQ